jgi:hypothetical protein
VVRNIQREDSFKVSQINEKIHLGGIGIIPDCQIWEKLHGELAVKHLAFQSLEHFEVLRSGIIEVVKFMSES